MPQKIPNFIYCSVTGARLAVRPDVLLARIKLAGSLERLQKTYLSRDARRLLKAGKTIEQIREELGYDPEHANNGMVFEVARTSSSMAKVRIRSGDHVDTFWRTSSFQVAPGWDRVPMTPAQVQETTKEACLNPGRWLDKDCAGCSFFANCRLLTKGMYRKN